MDTTDQGLDACMLALRPHHLKMGMERERADYLQKCNFSSTKSFLLAQ